MDYMISKEQVIEALKKVEDPEIHLDIWTMGLVYEINVKDDSVHIKMTFTTPFCPYGPQMLEDVKSKLMGIEGIKDVNVELVTEPPWEPSEELKSMLGI